MFSEVFLGAYENWSCKMTRQMTGAKMVVQALKDQGVDTVFGYQG